MRYQMEQKFYEREEAIAFAKNCNAHGIKAVIIEELEYLDEISINPDITVYVVYFAGVN